MTPTERVEALVKYALEAFDALDEVDERRLGHLRDLFEARVRERMAQAAQLWTNEVDDAKDGVPYGNIGAFFTVKEPLLKFTPDASTPRAIATPGGPVAEATDMPPHPIHFEPGDPNVGRQCIRCGNNIPAGCRYVHADWCNKREKKG